jgi:hypothetical protein
MRYDAQVKPEPPPQREPADDELDRPLVSTLTAVNWRSTLAEPQAGHRRPSPAAYADIESRASYGAPQSWQVNS